MPATGNALSDPGQWGTDAPDRKECCHRLAAVASGGYSAIDRRLAELDREWDLGRVVQLQAAAALLGGMMLGMRGGRKWLVLPAVVAGVLVQNALEDTSPVDFLLRRFGFRRAREVRAERYALKALRGDFHTVQPWPHGRAANNVERALHASEM